MHIFRIFDRLLLLELFIYKLQIMEMNNVLLLKLVFNRFFFSY
jgi:hypothetical protein